MIKSPNLRNTSPGMPDPTCEICPEEVSQGLRQRVPKISIMADMYEKNPAVL
jgi:hypothetical protein